MLAVMLVVGLFLILLVLICWRQRRWTRRCLWRSGRLQCLVSPATPSPAITIYVAAGWILLIAILIKTTQPAAELPVNAAVASRMASSDGLEALRWPSRIN